MLGMDLQTFSRRGLRRVGSMNLALASSTGGAPTFPFLYQRLSMPDCVHRDFHWHCLFLDSSCPCVQKRVRVRARARGRGRGRGREGERERTGTGTVNRKQETRNKKRKTTNRKQETGNRKQDQQTEKQGNKETRKQGKELFQPNFSEGASGIHDTFLQNNLKGDVYFRKELYAMSCCQMARPCSKEFLRA